MSKLIDRTINAFTKRFATKSLRLFGMPRVMVPVVARTVQDLNRHIQWTNMRLWKQRFNFVVREVKNQQKRISPVYTFKGGSDTVRKAPGSRGPTTHAPVHAERAFSKPSKSSRFLEPSSLVVGGLGFVVFASLAGPMLAKQLNYIDPLEAGIPT